MASCVRSWRLSAARWAAAISWLSVRAMSVWRRLTVEKALKAVPGVENAEVDLAAKCAKITLNADVADDVLMDAVAKKGFTPVKMG